MVIDNNRELSLLVFFSSNFRDGSLLAGEPFWFVLKIEQQKFVKGFICVSQMSLEGHCAIEIVY